MVRSQFTDELPWYSSPCGCEAGRGGGEKKRLSARTSVRGFGHPRANDRTDAANQGDASRANSELDSETERTASSPNQFMNQFASSPANVKGWPSYGDGRQVRSGSEGWVDPVGQCCTDPKRKGVGMRKILTAGRHCRCLLLLLEEKTKDTFFLAR